MNTATSDATDDIIPPREGAATDVPEAPIPPSRPDPFTADHNAAPYEHAQIDTEYHTDHGVRVLTVGDESLPGQVVKICSPLTTKIVTWSVSRRFAKPKIPSTNTGDPNDILIESVIFPANAAQAANDTLYSCSGRYTYHLLVPKIPGQSGTKWPMGVTSAETALSATRFYDNTDFDSKPLDASALRQGAPAQVNLNQVIQ